MKNDGTKSWPIERTKLIFERESCFDGDEVLLYPQKPGEQKKYDIIINNIYDSQPGEYKPFLRFYVDGNPVGELLTLTVIIIKKNSQNHIINQNKKIIKEFRDNFGLSEMDYTDEKLFEILKENNFNFEKSFESLFY